jgi:hypothetical protein
MIDQAIVDARSLQVAAATAAASIPPCPPAHARRVCALRLEQEEVHV